MSEKNNTKFGIKIDRMHPSQWSIGICFSHFMDETYLFINLFIWSISIGLLYTYDECEGQ